MQARKEIPIQIRALATLLIGVGVALVEVVQVLLAHVLALLVFKGQALFVDLAAVLSHFFALLLGQGGQKVLVVAVVLVLPVKLHIMANHETCLLQSLPVVRIREQHMHRGQLIALCQLDQLPGQQHAIFLGASQQARAADRRKGDRAQELGVIVQPMAVIGLSPALIKHILPPGVMLQIQGHRATQRLSTMHQQVMWRPACLWRGAASGVQRCQKSMAEQQVIARERVPVCRVELTQLRAK